MTRSPQGTSTSRIIIGWQSNTAVDLSIEAATLLAAATKAEVIGLFVENDAVIELAGHPFVRSLRLGGTQAQPVTRESMQAAYSRGAAFCRRALSAHAGKANVKWSFASERGELATKIRSVAAADDFVVLCGDIEGFGARQLMEELRSSPTDVQGILIAGLRTRSFQAGPVIAIDDGDDKGEQTIRLAARIAIARKVDLVVFVVASTDAEADDIIQRAYELAGRNVAVSTHRFPPGSPQMISAATSEIGPSFIVADRQGEPFVDDKSVLSLLRACEAPVLLLR